jgi:hypothetical protein
MTSLEKSYLPQYIHQYSEKPQEGYGRLTSECSDYSEVSIVPSTEVISFDKPNQNGYQQQNNLQNQSIYPPLISSPKGGGGGGDPNNITLQANHKTPLLINTKKKIVPTPTSYFGILLAFISGVFFTLCSGTVKYLTDLDPMELLIFRSFFQVIKDL